MSMAVEYPEPIIVDLPEKPEMSEAFSKLQNAAVAVVPLEELQMLYVQYVLRRCDGNMTHAARFLGVERRTLQRWTKSGKVQR